MSNNMTKKRRRPIENLYDAFDDAQPLAKRHNFDSTLSARYGIIPAAAYQLLNPIACCISAKVIAAYAYCVGASETVGNESLERPASAQRKRRDYYESGEDDGLPQVVKKARPSSIREPTAGPATVSKTASTDPASLPVPPRRKDPKARGPRVKRSSPAAGSSQWRKTYPSEMARNLNASKFCAVHHPPQMTQIHNGGLSAGFSGKAATSVHPLLLDTRTQWKPPSSTANRHVQRPSDLVLEGWYGRSLKPPASRTIAQAASSTSMSYPSLDLGVEHRGASISQTPWTGLPPTMKPDVNTLPVYLPTRMTNFLDQLRSTQGQVRPQAQQIFEPNCNSNTMYGATGNAHKQRPGPWYQTPKVLEPDYSPDIVDGLTLVEYRTRYPRPPRETSLEFSCTGGAGPPDGFDERGNCIVTPEIQSPRYMQTLQEPRGRVNEALNHIAPSTTKPRYNGPDETHDITNDVDNDINIAWQKDEYQRLARSRQDQELRDARGTANEYIDLAQQKAEFQRLSESQANQALQDTHSFTNDVDNNIDIAQQQAEYQRLSKSRAAHPQQKPCSTATKPRLLTRQQAEYQRLTGSREDQALRETRVALHPSRTEAKLWEWLNRLAEWHQQAAMARMKFPADLVPGYHGLDLAEKRQLSVDVQRMWEVVLDGAHF